MIIHSRKCFSFFIILFSTVYITAASSDRKITITNNTGTLLSLGSYALFTTLAAEAMVEIEVPFQNTRLLIQDNAKRDSGKIYPVDDLLGCALTAIKNQHGKIQLHKNGHKVRRRIK